MAKAYTLDNIVLFFCVRTLRQECVCNVCISTDWYLIPHFLCRRCFEALVASASVQQEPATSYGPEEIVSEQPPFNQPTLDASVTVETRLVYLQNGA